MGQEGSTAQISWAGSDTTGLGSKCSASFPTCSSQTSVAYSIGNLLEKARVLEPGPLDGREFCSGNVT